MSKTLKEMYERLSGINLVKQRLEDAIQRLDKMSELALDHEKRLVRLETKLEGQGRHKALPKPRRKS